MKFNKRKRQKTNIKKEIVEYKTTKLLLYIAVLNTIKELFVVIKDLIKLFF